MTDNAAEAQTILKWMETEYREFASIYIDDANQWRADLTIHANMATAHALTPAGTCAAIGGDTEPNKPATCGAFRPAADDHGDYPCVLKASHDTDRGTPHTDTDGDTWPSQNTPPVCGHPNPDQPDMHCTDVPHHYGIHDHLRTWWPNDTYPVEAGICIATGCHLYGGHPGNHHIAPRTPLTEELPW